MFVLSCADEHQIRGPEIAYVLDIYRLSAGLAAISSNQQLTLLDPLRLSQGPVKSLPTSHRNVTVLKPFDPANSIVCTAGEDGTVAVWDLRLDSAQAKVAQFEGANKTPILSIACSAQTHGIAVGTELEESFHVATINIWDVRASPTQRIKYSEVHSDDVTELLYQPNEPHILLSGSTDGLVNICDTRIPDEDEVVIQTFNHGASIHHAGFLSNTEVFAISHDERFALYDMAEVERGSAMANFGDAREALGCQYVANISPKIDGSGAIIGAGSQDRQMFELVHLSRGDSWSLDRQGSVGLPGAHGDEIVRTFCFFDEEQVVFTGGEDGRIKAWRPGK